MELGGYYPLPRSPRSPPRRMHSTIAIPGVGSGSGNSTGAGRRGSLPVTHGIADLLPNSISSAALQRFQFPAAPIGHGRGAANGGGGGLKQVQAESRYRDSPKRPRTAERVVRSRRRMELPDASVLEAEIKKLMESCEAHEATIKESKANIENNLFPRLNAAISSMSDMDTEADNLILNLNESLNVTRPELAANLSGIITSYQAKVSQMERTATPWRAYAHREASSERSSPQTRLVEMDDSVQFHPDGSGLGLAFGDEDEAFHDPRDGDRRIFRLQPAPAIRRRRPSPERNAEADDAAGIARVKGWANEVENHLASEIAILQTRTAADRRRRRMIWLSTVRGIILAVFVGLISLAIVGWNRLKREDTE